MSGDLCNFLQLRNYSDNQLLKSLALYKRIIAHCEALCGNSSAGYCSVRKAST